MKLAAKILVVQCLFLTLALAQTAPSAPTGLQDIAWSSGALLWWQNDDNVDSYQVQWSLNQSFDGIAGSSNPSSAFVFAGSLTSGTTYYWRVRAVDNNVTGAWSSNASFRTSGSTPNKPSPPTLNSPNNGATGVSTSPTLNWNASSGASIYALQLSTSSGFSSNVINKSSISGTSYSVSGLSSNTTYYWHVNATGGGGTSDYSNLSSFTTIAPIPSVPTLSSPSTGATGVATNTALTWSASTGATSYTVQISTVSTFASKVEQSGITGTTFSPSGLLNNTVYYWRVSATSSGGTSNFSSSRSFTTILAAPTLSSPSSGAAGISSSPTLSWNAVSGATSYRLQVSTSTDFLSTFVDQSGLNGTTSTISGLSAGTKYFWRVSATNSGITSAYSAVSNFTSVVAAPNLTSPANNSTSIPINPSLTWNSVTGATGYTLQVSTSPSFSSFFFNQSGLTTTSYSINTLANDSIYYWRVSATNGGVSGAFSSVFNFLTVKAVPGAPANLVSTPTATGALLKWNLVSGATWYIVEVNDPNFTLKWRDSSSSASSTASGLQSATSYTWRVQAGNSAGGGVWTSGSFRTPVAVPSAPITLTPTPTATDASLSWSLVSTATSYIVEVYSDVNLTNRVWYDSLTNPPSVASRLTSSSKYYWRVRAYNSGGPSGWTNSTFTTLSVYGVDSPTNPQVSDVTFNSASLSWNGPGQGAKFEIVLSPGNISFTNVNSSPLTVSSLQSNTRYSWQIRSTKSKDSSAWVAGPVFTTLSAPITPTAPILVSPEDGATKTSTKVTLVWKKSAGATEYQFQFSTKDNFPGGQTDSRTLSDTSVALDGLSNNTTYYWQVGVSDGAKSTLWSATWSFTTQSGVTVTAPTLVSPADRSTGVPTKPTLVWKKVAGATSYQIQYSTRDNFPGGQTQTVTVSDTTVALDGLSGNTTYYWQVGVSDGSRSTLWSSTWSFTTQGSTAIVAPTLISPKDKSTGVATKITLVWNKVPGVTDYQVQYSTKENFPGGQTDSKTISDTSLTLDGLSASTTYYWQVGVSDGSKSTLWSSTWSFTTQGSAATVPPTLVSPKDKSTGVATKLALVWNKVSGVTDYQVQYSTNENFPGGQTDSKTVSDTSLTLDGLSASTTYYWQVGVSDGSKSILWSSTWSFTTQNGTAASAPILVSPADKSSGLSTKPTLVWKKVPGATDYQVQYSTRDNFPGGQTDTKTVSDTTVILDGLSGNETYYWQVGVTSSLRTTLWSSVWSFTTVTTIPGGTLDPPSNLNATSLSSVSASLTWDGPGQGAKFELKITPGNISDRNANSPYTLGSLSPRTTYNWQLRTVKGNDSSNWVPGPTFTTLDESAGTLTAPSNLQVTNITSSGASLTWDGPGQGTKFDVKLSPGNILYTNVNSSPLTVNTLSPDTRYTWLLRSTKNSDSSAWVAGPAFTTSSPESAVERIENGIPVKFSLGQNYPNPFNPTTKIEFSVPSPTSVHLVIYNALGNEVQNLVNGFYHAGRYFVTWNASAFPSGVYFYRIQTSTFVDTKRLVLLK